MLKYVFFDLDGTLTNPALGITNSIMYALEKMGYEIPERASLYRFIGPPLIPAFREFIGMSETEAEKALNLYREYFSVKGLFENKVYHGIPEALEKIKSSGKTIFVATSKPEQYARQIIEHFSLDKYLDKVFGATMDEKRVEKSDVISYALESVEISENLHECCIMCGDRRHDIIGAKECGIYSMGVTWGFGSRKELEDAGADIISGSIAEMSQIIVKM